MEPTTSLQPMQVQRWLRSDPQDLRALLNALQHSYEDQKLSKQKKETLSRTHTTTHTLPFPPFCPSPSPVAIKKHYLGKVGCSVQKKPPEACAKERTGATCLWQTLRELQKWRWLSRKFGWLVRLCRREVRRPAGRKTRVKTCKGQPPLKENYRIICESMLLR